MGRGEGVVIVDGMMRGWFVMDRFVLKSGSSSTRWSAALWSRQAGRQLGRQVDKAGMLVRYVCNEFCGWRID